MAYLPASRTPSLTAVSSRWPELCIPMHLGTTAWHRFTFCIIMVCLIASPTVEMLAKDHVHRAVFTGFLLPGIELSILEKGVTEDEMIGWHHQLNGHVGHSCLLTSWLQSPSAVIWEPEKIKPATVSTSPHLIAMKRWDQKKQELQWT